MKNFLEGNRGEVLKGLLAYHQAFEKLSAEGFDVLFFENELCIFEQGSKKACFRMELEGGKVLSCSNKKLQELLQGLL